MGNGISYYMRRGAQERTAAGRSTGKARKAREQLADRYHELVSSSDEFDRLQVTPEG
jgi:hypothetical protein